MAEMLRLCQIIQKAYRCGLGNKLNKDNGRSRKEQTQITSNTYPSPYSGKLLYPPARFYPKK